MFCMNCGQQLPEGAKFCLMCGTPQGKVAPETPTSSPTINIGSKQVLVPATCPNCSASLRVDSQAKIARCNSCGTECLVQDAINAFNVRGNVQVENATINVNGTNMDSLLHRVEMMLADGDFNGAMQKCDSMLDMNPTEGKIYLFMLLSNLGCRKRSDLAYQHAPFDGNNYYLRAMQYCDEEIKAELSSYVASIAAKHAANQMNPQRLSEYYFGTRDGHRLWWRVLKVQNRTALIVARDIFCDMPFNQFIGEVSWHSCTLRKWLNNEFYNSYFTPDERARILNVNIENKNSPISFSYHFKGPTTDRVFLLSVSEARALFPNDKSRALGSIWWLRSSGNDYFTVSAVNRTGSVVKSGDRAVNSYGVRPAMWINLD